MTFLKDESGQGMVEYALIIGLIAVVLIAVIAILRTRIQSNMQSTGDALNGDGADATTAAPHSQAAAA